MASVEYLELADWRRRVASMYAAWRDAAERDAAAATHAFREQRDALFRDHPQSPLPAPERPAFEGLDHWPYDPAYRMTVVLEPSAGGARPPAEVAGPLAARSDDGPIAGGSLALPSSGPGEMRFRRIGRVALRGVLEGHWLSVFWIEGYGGGLFLPFRDATSGRQTYGAGRYLLDGVKGADHGGDPRSATLILDLNMAYHPSCAYDPRWVCPLAPPENTLPVEVPVGERLRRRS